MLYIGLTGNIASGKSEVARRFAALGATVIDADQLSRDAVAPGTAALAAIAARWGAGMLQPDGQLDRAALRSIVFGDPAALAALNAIVHPEVGRLRDVALAAARRRGDRVVVYDVPLLFEAKLADEFDRIVLVDAPEPVRLTRLVEGRGIPRADATRMIASQMPAAEKRARADLVIENDGTLDDLHARVTAAWERLTAPNAPSSLAP